MAKNYANLFQFVLFEKISFFSFLREREISYHYSSEPSSRWKEFYHFDLQLLSTVKMFSSFFQSGKSTGMQNENKKKEENSRTLEYQWARIDNSLPKSNGFRRFVDFLIAICCFRRHGISKWKCSIRYEFCIEWFSLDVACFHVLDWVGSFRAFHWCFFLLLGILHQLFEIVNRWMFTLDGIPGIVNRWTHSIHVVGFATL